MAKTTTKNIRAELTVSRKEYITPHYIRIYLTGKEIPLFDNTTKGVNNKILVPPAGVNKIHFPEFDYEKMEWNHPPEEVRPTIRTYTHRGIDLKKNEIWIDFVAHGDEGPASAWALRADKGDVLGVMMHDGKTALYTEADWYLLVGDATAIPVIGAILEDLPETAEGVCILEVHGEEDRQELFTKAKIRFVWVYNPLPQEGSQLAALVKEEILPKENRFGYVAAEFSAVREIRTYLRKENQWKKEELYAYSYWKSGVAEDKSTRERQQEKESIG